MGIAQRVTGFIRELRSSLENPQTPLSFPAEWLLDIFNGGRTDSGLRVSEMTALQVGTVLACCNIVGNGIACPPLNVYERTVSAGAGNTRLGKKLALEHQLFDLLHDEPNEEMTSFTFRKTLMVHCLLWGNAYAEIERNNSNDIVALWPRNPARTRPVRVTGPTKIEGTTYPLGTMMYETSETRGDSQMGQDGTESLDNRLAIRRLVLAEDMIHIPGLSLDGRMGQSTVYLARQTIGLALATEKYGAKFFGNNARPAGVLEIPAAMEPKALENLKRSWAEAHGGENAHKTAVLEMGVKYNKIGATPEEGQYLQTRQYVRTDIATIFSVPPHMVGEKEAGKSSVEQSSIEFNLYCIGPWITAWEQELKRKLMPKRGRTAGQFFAKFDTRRLFYPDAASRSKFYATGRQWGFLNGNDIRELEDMDPIPGPAGAKYWMPVNMQDAGDIDQIIPPGAPAPPGSVKDVADKTSALAKQAQLQKPAAKPGKPGKPAPKAGKKGKNSIDLLELARFLRAVGYGGTDDDISGPYVMRHGTTPHNLDDKYREWTDTDLDDEGRATVKQAAEEYLKPAGIKRIIAAEHVRNQTTAKIVGEILGLPVETDGGLNTWKHGFGGQTKEAAGDKVKYFIEHPDEVPENGESLNAFRARSQATFDKYAGENDASGPVLLITSGSNIESWNQDEDSEEKALSGMAPIQPGGVGVIEDDEVTVLFAGDEHVESKKGS